MKNLSVRVTLSLLVSLSCLASCVTLSQADIPPDPPQKEIPPRGEIVSPRERILEENLFAMYKWGEKVKKGNQ